MPFTTNIGCICGTLFLRVKGACRVLPLSRGTATLFVEHIAPSHTILCYWHLVHKTHRSVISTLFSSFFLLISMIGLEYTVFVSVFFFFYSLLHDTDGFPFLLPRAAVIFIRVSSPCRQFRCGDVSLVMRLLLPSRTFHLHGALRNVCLHIYSYSKKENRSFFTVLSRPPVLLWFPLFPRSH